MNEVVVPFQPEDKHLRPARRRAQERPNPGEPLWVEKPEVKEVMDVETGEHLAMADVIGTDYARLVQLRLDVLTRMRKGDPLYLCSMCAVPVYICRVKEGFRFFFKHRHEDGSCPAQTRGALSQDEIDARKYNGAKESRLHRRMKDWVCQCLAADGRFAAIAKEPTWKGPLTGERRRPDVRAEYNGLPIAFEIQLSTTHLNVIAARREFYLQEGGLLFWVFAEFDSEHRRMTDDDVFYNNNHNAFVVNAGTVEASLEAKEFRLDCIWAQPMKGGGHTGLRRKLVPFHELTLDPRTQRAYFFDFEAAARGLKEVSVEAERQRLRDDFEAWMGSTGYYAPDKTRQWEVIRQRFKTFGIDLPQYLGDFDRQLLTALYSAKHNRPWGQRQNQLVELAHRVANGEKNHATWFMHAANHYGRLESMKSEGKQLWSERLEKLRAEYKQDPSLFEPKRDAQAMVELLFPELVPLP